MTVRRHQGVLDVVAELSLFVFLAILRSLGIQDAVS